MTTTPTHSRANGTRKTLEVCLVYTENTALGLNPALDSGMLFPPGPAAEHTFTKN